jgi:4-hydroxy-tetrahydrodipicolinate synthase
MFKGIFTPMITVFDKEGKIDLKGNEVVINSLIDDGINGILFLGSTGEFFSMSMEEKKRLVRFVIKTVNKRVPVLIGTGGTIVEEVIELTQYAEHEGADAAVVVCPYYFKLDDESLYRYYAEVAKSVKLPIIIYNFPDRTSVNIEPKLVLRLATDFNNIVGIKDTVDNMSHTRKLIQTVKSQIKDFAIFSGFDEYFIPNLLSGGNGLIGGLSNIDPKLFAEIYKAYIEKDFTALDILQKKVNDLMGLYDIAQVFIPVLKTAVNLTGRSIQTVSTKPLNILDKEQIEKVKNILRKVDLIS